MFPSQRMNSYLVLGVAKHSLHGPVCGLLDGFLDLSVRCRLGETACQVNHWHISHWHPEGHACQLTTEREDKRDVVSLSWLHRCRWWFGWKLNVCPHPLSSGMTLPTALAAPVEAGMMFWWAPRPSRQALALGPSTVFWVAVYAWTVVYGRESHTAHSFSFLVSCIQC